MTRQGSIVKIEWKDLVKFGLVLISVISPLYVSMNNSIARQDESMARQDERIKSMEKEISMMRDDMKDLRTFLMKEEK